MSCLLVLESFADVVKRHTLEEAAESASGRWYRCSEMDASRAEYWCERDASPLVIHLAQMFIRRSTYGSYKQVLYHFAVEAC